MSHTYNYIFLCSMLDKYDRLIREAKTKEMRDFCIGQWVFYSDKRKNYFN